MTRRRAGTVPSHGAAGRGAARGGGAWRGLGWFWAAVLATALAAGIVLQWLGPPRPPAPPAPAVAEGKAPSPSLPPSPPPQSPSGPAPAPLPAAPTAGLSGKPGSPVAPPDPALLEPSTMFANGMLPRIGPDGRAPMRAYAAPYDPFDKRPRVALLIGGIGMAEADSEEAIRTLPAQVSLAVSPYAFRPERLLDDARAAGHELVLALPLEPEGYPIDDPGSHALLTGNPAALNRQRLEWALTRFAGYVGATGALNGMRGERFAADSVLMDRLMQDLAARGLLYIDPRPGAAHPPFATGRSVDVVVDEPAVRSEIEANLARLEQVAKDRGSALGLIGRPLPVTLDRIAAWASALEARGLILVPVSAISQPPPTPQKAAGTGNSSNEIN